MCGMRSANQTPEQAARGRIDAMLSQSGWSFRARRKSTSAPASASPSVSINGCRPGGLRSLLDKKPVGVVEAKPEIGARRSRQSRSNPPLMRAARLKWVNNQEPLPFVYESTGVLIRFTDGRDPKPRSRELFGFPPGDGSGLERPAGLAPRTAPGLPELDPTGLQACQVSAIEKLEASSKDDRPRALIQMATGSQDLHGDQLDLPAAQAC